jgi:hypothetical protein
VISAYETSRLLGDLNQYVIIAVYEPVDIPVVSAMNGTSAPPANTPDTGLGAGAQTGNPLVDIPSGNVPLATASGMGTWSILSMLFSVVGIVLSGSLIVAAIIGKGELARGSLSGTVRVVTCLLSLITLLLWLYLDDFSGSMVWVNAWTPVIAALFVVDLVLFAVCKVDNRYAACDSGANT